MPDYQIEVNQRQRFEFGKNWQRFLKVLDDERIAEAERSLKKCLRVDSLDGLTFLDIGSGSGLFSLAACRLGATVYSFDYDAESVNCTKELKRRYFQDHKRWRIESGSVLDDEYLERLGQFDIVYSWGVLHHTGQMWHALDNACKCVTSGGALYISIYNYQRYWTTFYTVMKRSYNKAPRLGKWLIAGVWVGYQAAIAALRDLLFLQNPVRRYKDKKKERGMTRIYDALDWVGGYPFETAKPEDVFEFCRERGFVLDYLSTVGAGYGCNEFVFRKARD